MAGPTSDDDPTRPAAGPGGWSAPAAGGPGPQYPPGSYPPPGPQGPYGSGAPSAGGVRGNRGLVIALVVGLVILLALCVALVYAFTRDSGETVSAGSGRTEELLVVVPGDVPSWDLRR